MNVLMAHGAYRFPGGEERHVELLTAGLRQAGARVTRWDVGAVKDGSGLVSLTRLAGGMVWRPGSSRAAHAAVQSANASIAHFHNLLPVLTPAALHGAKRAGAAVVLTVHNYRLFCPGGTLTDARGIHSDCIEGSSLACALRRNPRRSRAESAVYGVAIELHRRLRLVERYVDTYVAVSRYLADVLVRAGFPAARIHVVPTGIPPVDVVRMAPEYALYVGRLSEEKGIMTLLRAARATPDVPLVVAGDGPLRAEVERSVSKSFRYVGHLGSKELDRLHQRAAFLVAPSECPEALPLAALEALARGVPVLTTRLGGLAELADGGGCRTFDAGAPDSLARAMRDMWALASTSDSLSHQALANVRRNYDLSSRTRDILSLYRDIA